MCVCVCVRVCVLAYVSAHVNMCVCARVGEREGEMGEEGEFAFVCSRVLAPMQQLAGANISVKSEHYAHYSMYLPNTAIRPLSNFI